MDNAFASRGLSFLLNLEKKKGNLIFLVPYFGACIHVPPPPPNQIIFNLKRVSHKRTIRPFRFRDHGYSRIENDVALAAYKMEMEFSEIYEEEG